MQLQSASPAANTHHMSTCPGGRRPGRARAAAVMIVLATALPAAACSSGSPSSAGASGSPQAGGSADSSSGLAYSRCVRAHGVPGFPDPGSGGQLSKQAVVTALRAVSDSRAAAATGACARLNPAGQENPVLTAQDQQDYLRAVACMRSHGITGFPDPTFPGGHLDLQIPASIDTTSRQFTRAAQTCTKLIPAGLPHNSGSGG
jgi:hypothetical protein